MGFANLAHTIRINADIKLTDKTTIQGWGAMIPEVTSVNALIL
jgi:hypothetical protein